MIAIEFNELDPVRDNYARFIAFRQVQELNRAIIETAVGQGQQYLIQAPVHSRPSQIPPQVVAAPTRAEPRNLAPVQPTVVAFFAPAVLALVLQHMAVTLTALSLVRERLSGAMDIFRVAPVRSARVADRQVSGVRVLQSVGRGADRASCWWACSVCRCAARPATWRW